MIMIASQILPSNIADYLRLDTGEYTDTELQVYIDVAKKFIKSYTGIEDVTIKDESVGAGDDETKAFRLDNNNVLPQSVYIDGVLKTETTDYKIDTIKGEITFVTAPLSGASITSDYSLGIDAFVDFVIVVYILCQDMYDNRSMYVDKNNLNKVVDSILGMHCTNLL